MNRIISILMRRDGMSRQEAIELIKNTRETILESDPFEADEVLISMLGLEPDYIMELL